MSVGSTCWRQSGGANERESLRSGSPISSRGISPGGVGGRTSHAGSCSWENGTKSMSGKMFGKDGELRDSISDSELDISDCGGVG